MLSTRKKVIVNGMVVSSSTSPIIRMAVEAPDAVVAITQALGDRLDGHRIALDRSNGIVRLTFTPKSQILLYGIETLTAETMPETTNRHVRAQCRLIEYQLPSGQLGFWIAVTQLTVLD